MIFVPAARLRILVDQKSYYVFSLIFLLAENGGRDFRVRKCEVKTALEARSSGILGGG
jgi:hypothetical protein